MKGAQAELFHFCASHRIRHGAPETKAPRTLASAKRIFMVTGFGVIRMEASGKKAINAVNRVGFRIRADSGGLLNRLHCAAVA